MRKIFLIVGLSLFSLNLYTLENKMSFELFYECSGSGCSAYILAEGVIVETTPLEFKDFIDKIEFKPKINFNSPGGNLIASMQLGRIIREKGLSTYLSDHYVTEIGQEVIQTSKNVVCYSACSYAFLGGISRTITDTAKFGVHQFFSNIDMGDSNTQYLAALLSYYIDEMGVDRAMFDIASSTSGEEITLINDQLLMNLNIDNTHPQKGVWELYAGDNGDIYTCAETKIRNKKAVGIFCVFKERTEFIGFLSYTIDQNFRSPSDLEEIYVSESRNRKPNLYVGNAVFELEADSWTKVDNETYSVMFIVTNEIVSEINNSMYLNFDGAFANYASDIEPNIDFSTINFKKNTLALMK